MVQGPDILISKLDQIEQRYGQIEVQISDPETAKDSSKIISLSKEQAKLRDIVVKYRRYKKAQAGIEDAKL
ncbi:MAG: PCRF domain-containing protein, partial [Phycisphaerae bacterium]